MAIYGYCRVSTAGQSADMQINALKEQGVPADKIFSDILSGSTKDRPELNKLVSMLNNGDTLVVWKLDRLGRSVRNLSSFLEEMNTKGVVNKSRIDSLVTSNKSYIMLFHHVSVVSEMEKENTNERIREGIKNAQKHGTRTGKAHGRPKVSSPKVALALDLVASGDSVNMASRKTGVSVRTIFRRLSEVKQAGGLVKQTTVFDEIKKSVKRGKKSVKQISGRV